MARIPRLTAGSPGRRTVTGAVLGLVVALVLIPLRGTTLFETIEWKLVDARTRHFASDRTPDADIVIAQVEESDIEGVRRQLGERWPWPLDYNAYIVRVIDEAGASALMVDILHLDRGAGPDDVPDSDTLPPAARQLREIEADGAATYGAALKAFGRAALAFELSDHAQTDIEARRRAAVPRAFAGDVPGNAIGPTRSSAELPVRRVAEGALHLGFTNVETDRDGVVRRAAFLGRWGERPVHSLAAATAACAAAVRPSPPSLARAPVLINFHAGDIRGGYTRVAPLQILDWALRKESEGELPQAARDALGGKIVILGVNAVGLKDVVATPLGTMDGPVFQATVLDNLLQQDGRVHASPWTERLLLVVLLGLLGGLGARLRGRWTHALPIALGLLFAVFGYARFGGGTAHDLFTPLLGIVLTWGGTSAQRALTEGRRNKWLEGTFGRYMAPSVIEALKRDPALLELGGRERRVTVLFSDIAGFTSVSEDLDPAQLVGLLNRYLTIHCAAVLDEDGVVDKFLGDGVLAFFGDPVPQDDHALRACRAALRVQRGLPELEPALRALGIESLDVRIGINTGKAVVGNMGSEQRFDYTCMGDTVNLASRFEGANKAFGIRIMIGPGTAREVTPEMLVKPLGGIVVVGREEPVSVYELVGEREGASEALIAHVDQFEVAVAAARRGDVIGARRALAEADRQKPGDAPVAWFRAVLADLDPGTPWPGVTILGRK